jgi:hypothetical protein
VGQWIVSTDRLDKVEPRHVCNSNVDGGDVETFFARWEAGC